jgi:hypothetical protein
MLTYIILLAVLYGANEPSLRPEREQPPRPTVQMRAAKPSRGVIRVPRCNRGPC